MSKATVGTLTPLPGRTTDPNSTAYVAPFYAAPNNRTDASKLDLILSRIDDIERRLMAIGAAVGGGGAR